MAGSFKKDDLRIIKTHKALVNAMLELLGRRNFERITVNDLCGEALISRATFYVYFKDKYDLLHYWLSTLKIEFTQLKQDEIDEKLTDFINNNMKIIKNTVEFANAEVTQILHEFMFSVISELAKIHSNRESKTFIITAHFCAAGMVDFLAEYTKNNLPMEMILINNYLRRLVEAMIHWDLNQTDF